MKRTTDRIICVFRMTLSSKEVTITITRVEKCYKLTRVIDTDVYEQYYARLAQAYNVMVKMIDDLRQWKVVKMKHNYLFLSKYKGDTQYSYNFMETEDAEMHIAQLLFIDGATVSKKSNTTIVIRIDDDYSIVVIKRNIKEVQHDR